MLSFMPTTTPTALDSPAFDLTYNGRPELHSPNVQTPLVFSSPQPAMPTHHLLSNQQQPTSSRLPALPSTVLKKIQAGEFVNFNDLLPHYMSPSTSDDFTIQLSQSSVTNPTSLSLVPRSQSSRAKVYDFSSWLQAWNNFLRATIYYHPMLTDELLFYQSMMCQHGTRYIFEDICILTIGTFVNELLMNPPCTETESIRSCLPNICVPSKLFILNVVTSAMLPTIVIFPDLIHLNGQCIIPIFD